MNNSNWFGALIVPALLASGCTDTVSGTDSVSLGLASSEAPDEAASFEVEDDGDDEELEGDVSMLLVQCPDAVQDTIMAHIDGGTIVELERTTDHGEVLYEVDALGTDGVFEFDVGEDGMFLGYEQDDDED